MHALIDFRAFLPTSNRTYFVYMASSSSSHQHDAFSGIEPLLKRRKVSESSRLFDVFINHRGPDVKNTLALQLYNTLQDLEIRAFLDSEEKELGHSFPSTIETAIRSALVHVAIFSKRYAESPWCLAELVLMLQSNAKIIPVFYDVDPSALRHIEKGVYAHAFIQYQEKSRYLEKLQEWKEALQSISFIAGQELNSSSHCKNIVSAVQKEVQRKKSLIVAKYPVGLPKIVKHFEKQCIDKLVRDFESQCGVNQQPEGKANIVGIFGMGGVGKTTLSKELFNRKRSDYSRSCFLFDVRDSSLKSNLSCLQAKLLRDLFDKDHPSISSVEDGTNRLSDFIQRSNILSFLIVLDDIDHLEQLDALSIMDVLNKPGNSLIIVTTRDAGVLVSARITIGYNLKGMDTHDAKELFCWHAFRQSYPSSGYERLVNLFVDVCGGLPLSLQVLGSHVHGTDASFWELELKKVQKTLPRDIHKRLKISIDTLDNEEKQIFMDIACFFIGELKSQGIRVWEASGWSAQHALQRLKNKCLLEEIEQHNLEDPFGDIVLRMHDHLRDLGREMAEEPGHPLRLWRSPYCDELADDLSNPCRLRQSESRHRVWHSGSRQYLISERFENILTQTKGRCLHSVLDPSMGFSIKCFLGQSDNMAETSTSLLWLELSLQGHTLTDIPPGIPLQNLRSLGIFDGRLERLWQDNIQVPFLLKELHINRIKMLKELSLGLLRCLERVTIYDCRDLTSVTGISHLTKLVELNMGKCSELEMLSFVQMSCVKKIRISDCPCLKNVAGMSDLRKLVELNIHNCSSLEELSFVQVSCLEKITISDCERLKSLAGICDARKLVLLNIDKCTNLQDEELCFLQQSSLEKIIISDFPNLNRLKGISNVRKLVELQIKHCPKLDELSLVRFSCLEKVYISDCLNLQGMTVSHLEKLVKLKIHFCEKIEELSLVQLNCLERLETCCCLMLKNIEVKGCKIFRMLDIENVVNLNICGCPELEYLPELGDLRQLKVVFLHNCPKLKKMPQLCDFKFTLQCCRELQTKEGLCDFEDFQQLFISECPQLQFDELNFGRLSWLKVIAVESCCKMHQVAGIERLHSLERMQLLYCASETFWNYILKMEKLRLDFFQVIGRAVDGAESKLNASFFCDGNISANSVIQIGTNAICNEDLVSAIILCAVVVVNTSAGAKMINDFIKRCEWNPWAKFEVRQGEWIITLITTNEDEGHRYILSKRYCFPFDYVFTDCAVTEDVIVKKGYKATVKKGEEHKILNVLHRIVDKLYQK